MTVIRSKPVPLGKLALRKELVLTTQRGQLIATSWPRKRGKPTSPITKAQNGWLKWTARALPYAASQAWDTATKAAKGTGLYPRDILTMAAAGTLYDIVTPDGRLLTRTDDQLEDRVFQGAILELTLDFNIGGGLPVVINWPLPVIDTFGFWNAGNPDRLTIPVGVNVVELACGSLLNSGISERFIIDIRDQTNNVVARATSESLGAQGTSTTTGAISVIPGDWFNMQCTTGSARSLLGSQRPFFTLNVLGAS